MAKINRVEACIFCGDVPCTCNGPVVKVKTPRKKAESKPVKQTDLDFTTVEIPTERPKFKSVDPTPEPERDLSLEEALRNLLPILASQERTRVQRLLARPYPKDVDMRLARWKDDHAR